MLGIKNKPHTRPCPIPKVNTLTENIWKLFLWSFLTCVVQTRWLWTWWIRGFLKDFSSFHFHFKDGTWRCCTACWLVLHFSTNQTNLLSDVLFQRNSSNTIFSKIKKKKRRKPLLISYWWKKTTLHLWSFNDKYTAQILSPHRGSAVQDTTWDTAKTQQGQAALAFN